MNRDEIAGEIGCRTRISGNCEGSVPWISLQNRSGWLLWPVKDAEDPLVSYNQLEATALYSCIIEDVAVWSLGADLTRKAGQPKIAVLRQMEIPAAECQSFDLLGKRKKFSLGLSNMEPNT